MGIQRTRSVERSMTDFRPSNLKLTGPEGRCGTKEASQTPSGCSRLNLLSPPPTRILPSACSAKMVTRPSRTTFQSRLVYRAGEPVPKAVSSAFVTTGVLPLRRPNPLQIQWAGSFKRFSRKRCSLLPFHGLVQISISPSPSTSPASASWHCLPARSWCSIQPLPFPVFCQT